MLRNIFLSLISIILFTFIIEMSFRITVPNFEPDNKWRISIKGLGDFKSNLNFIEKNKAGRTPFQVITNNQGLRNVSPINENTQGKYRILAIGDSFTFGFGVNNQDTWSSQLENLLQQLKPNQNIEIINAGFPGYTIKDEYEYLINKGLKLLPNLIILGVYENDITDLSPGSKNEFSREKKLTHVKKFSSLFFLERSYVLTWVIYKINNFKNKNTTLINQHLHSLASINDIYQMKNEYILYLNKFDQILKEKKIPYIIIYFPAAHTYLSNKIDIVEQVLIENYSRLSCKFLNSRFELRKKGTIEQLFLIPEDAHLSRYGNQIIAKYIYDHYFSQNFFK